MMATHHAPPGTLTQSTPDGNEWWWDGTQWHPIVPWPAREQRAIAVARWSFWVALAEAAGGALVIIALMGQGPEPAVPYTASMSHVVLGAMWVIPSIVLGIIALAMRPPTLAARQAAVAAILIGLGTALVTIGVPWSLMLVASNT